jgi:MerR family transcriptional regulator, Zn(II)-responsive regulator of zntA
MSIKVKDLAKRCGVSGDCVRFYTKIGLLRPVRDPENGYKLFSEQDVRRLKFIRIAKYLGFTLNEIEMIIESHDNGKTPCCLVREFLRGHIEANRKQLEKQMALQERMEKTWERWTAMPDCVAAEHVFCRLIEAAAEFDFLAPKEGDD